MSELKTKNDEQLWSLMKAGDKSAFEYIYRISVDPLFNYGKKFSRDEALVEDVIQDLFIYIWNNREKLSSTDSIKAYLFISLRRSLFKKLKEKNKYQLSSDHVDIFKGTEFAMEELMIIAESKKEHEKKIKEAILSLSKRQQEVIYLKYTQGLGNKQIAELLSINYQSVRNVMMSAIKALRSKLLLTFILIYSILISTN
jgi:RNA polymerase sigma factor (sigma-70 family)